MRIVHVVEPFSSGIITFIINLTEVLPQHEHIVIHGTRTTEDEMTSVRNRFPDYVKFKVWKSVGRELNVKNDLRAGRELHRLLKNLPFDVLHLHSAKAGAIGKVIAALLGQSSKAIYTPNGAPFLRKDISQFKVGLFRFVEFITNRWIGYLVCCGRSESEVYQKIGLKNIYINNGVRLPRSYSREFQYPVTVGCSGILTAQKDPKTFFEIAESFSQDNRVNFVWVGDGTMHDLRKSSAVRVTGWLDKPIAAEEIARIDVYLSAALWEGLPFAVLESMARGSCLLLRPCPGNVELVKPQENGYLFNDTEEGVALLTKLLGSLDIMLEFGKNSRILCEEEYSIDEMGQKYEKFYRSLGA